MVCALARDSLWMQILRNLMERTSVRAYFHVMHRLLQCDPEYQAQEAASWVWDAEPLPTAKQVLQRNLERLWSVGETGVDGEPMSDFESYWSDHHLWVGLPCGHTDKVHARSLQALTDVDCMDVRCRESGCDRYILGRAESHIVVLGMQRESRKLWMEMQEMFEQRDQPIEDGDRVVTMKAAALWDALKTAEQSLRAPRSITPTALCPTTLPEHEPVRSMFRRALRKSNSVLAMTSNEMFDTLLRNAIAALDDDARGSSEDVSAGAASSRYMRFLRKWVVRAVHYVMWAEASVTSSVTKKTMDGMAELMQSMVLKQETATEREES